MSQSHEGSSPLTRGKPEADRARREQVRLIPAHAGKTCRSRCSLFSPCGSSPLTRGKRGAEARPPGGDGLIPAHAGKTSAVCCATVSVEAHPRSRGENHSHGVLEAEAQGSSPLTRGKRGAVDGGRDGLRLIPAHAGKTVGRLGRRSQRRAHPRSRGENSTMPAGMAVVRGSSPLTRGKRCRRTQAACREGLIPAHAGKTASAPPPAWTSWAHPRSRGENGRWTTAPSRWPGSSPLTRGKLPCLSGRGPCIGLIPAHAGKTVHRLQHRNMAWAHPRSRGENRASSAASQYGLGSSPLTRGKPMTIFKTHCGRRLIPAHAGKTFVRHALFVSLRAHPRSRGENLTNKVLSRARAGSSPLTRGKLINVR